ncbi:hypothetical protein K3495_g2559 [Podosphaera aphanis]|nr:hypothetical protein K3495_g2559 [Podosphaera aphanis]
MPRLTKATQERIVELLKEGNSCRDVAIRVDCSPCVVGRLRKTISNIGSGSKGGRPSKLTPRLRRQIVHDITNETHRTPKQVAASLKEVHSISARKKAKKPALTSRHRKARLNFAQKHKEWTIEDWKKVIWSDETKINRICSDGIHYTWRKPQPGLAGRGIVPTLKFGGGGIMIGGYMAWSGPGVMVQVVGKMKAQQYISILQENLTLCMEAASLLQDMPPADQLIFPQDNDPKHTARATTSFLRSRDIKCLDWPAQSPDLNPIEHIWEEMKRRIGTYHDPPKGVGELWQRVQREWALIPASTCRNLIESMPRRIEAVLAAKGGNTKY